MNDKKYTTGSWHCMKYAGNIYIIDSPSTNQKELLNAESVGIDTAYANGILTAQAPMLLQQLEIMVAIVHANLSVLPEIALHQYERSLEVIYRAENGK